MYGIQHSILVQMEDHLISRVDKLSDAPNLPTDTNEYEASGENEPLIPSIECRICQEEDNIKNLEPYKSGYTTPTPQSEDTIIDISGSWTIDGTPVDLHDPRVLAMAATEQRLLENTYNDYEDNSTSAASFCRSAAIILMALLLLRHALTIGYGDSDDNDDDDPSAFFALFVLRAAGFLLPCYIMIWAISILQRCRQTQETETLAAADVAIMIQAGQHRGLQVTIAPGPATSPTPVIPVPMVGRTHEPAQ
ncbi:hypothetical protein L2E82_46591 [Cichorium intybus]|uniref:Uncharacterized protein n=1 Tax=Cichorium intybus TaxID=13427 RepID=A0ACB8YTC7_CICIN|nr:hypothetical protein L2E82_46591 [Cichorium intybus]